VSTHRVIVIGSGVVGLSAAWNLVRRGAEVTVVSALQPELEIGWGSVAWSNASSKVRLGYPDHYSLLNREGMTAARALADELGSPRWLNHTGAVEVVAGSGEREKLRADLARLAEFGYPAEELTTDAFADTVPGVRIGEDETAAYFPSEGWIDSAAFATALTGAIIAAGGRFVRRRVTGFTRSGGDIVSVTLEDGTVLTADTFLLAAGARTTELAGLAEIEAPVLPADDAKVPGLVAVITSPPHAIDRLLQVPKLIIRPFGEGRALIAGDSHGHDIDVRSQREQLITAAEVLLGRAAERVPATAGAAILDVRLSRRVIPRDGITIAGPAEGTDNAYLLATHSGFTLGPLLGRLATTEILDGEVDELLRPYRPARFSQGASRLDVERVDSASA
jgi:glycine/D-amino acid oxidase-like deaminating enzyme